MSNVNVLTRSHGAIAAKKRTKKDQIKEIVFDDEARREFLTGFHKRKVAKKEAAKARAIEREKQARLEARREQRRMLAERAKENAAHVESAYGAVLDGDDGETEQWSGIGFEQMDEKEKEKAEEYEDEEHLATVTVVEDFDPHTIIHGPPRTTAPHLKTPPPDLQTPTKRGGRDIVKAKASNKAKKIRYETKAARKAQKDKQQARRTEKAQRAGGKNSRKPGRRKR